MIVNALKNVWSDGNVSCMVLSEAHLPLKRVIEQDVLPMETLRYDPETSGIPIATPGNLVEMLPLHVADLPSEHFGRPGVIVARNPLQACQFLAEHWVPQGHDALDGVVRALRAAPESDHRRFDALIPFVQTDSETLNLFMPRDDNPAVVRVKSKFDDTFRAVGTGFDRVFLPATGRRRHGGPHGIAAVVRERSRRFGRHTIPGWDLLLPSGASDSRRVSTCFEGRWTESALRRMDPDQRDAFDREGRMVLFVEGDATQFRAWEAGLLVRVPERWPRTPGEVPPEARLPAAWLVDARCPVGIRADVPLVTRPADAAAILSRVTRNIYLHDGVPAAAASTIRARAGEWLALCTPASWRDA